MIRLLVLWWLLTPLTAWASEFPALFDVTGVAPDDVLNIREKPSGSALKLGELAHDRTDVEVVAVGANGKWGLVNSGESSGWVSLRYLERVSSSGWANDEVALSCSGTEPFWVAKLGADRRQILFQLFDDPVEHFLTDWYATPENYTGGTLGLGASGLSGSLFATISSGLCNDGMSDRNFGLGATLFIVQNGQPFGYRGCCSLVAN